MISEKKLFIDITNSIIKMDQFMKYKNGCFSAMKYYKNGSLLVGFIGCFILMHQK